MANQDIFDQIDTYLARERSRRAVGDGAGALLVTLFDIFGGVPVENPQSLIERLENMKHAIDQIITELEKRRGNLSN